MCLTGDCGNACWSGSRLSRKSQKEYPRLCVRGRQKLPRTSRGGNLGAGLA
jgi:hypothetical protein